MYEKEKVEKNMTTKRRSATSADKGCSYIDVRKGKSLKGNDNKKTKRWSPFMFELVVYFKATSADKGHTTPRP